MHLYQNYLSIQQVIVFVKIVILKLGDIDTMRDKFSADVFIQCKWREPALDGKFKSVCFSFLVFVPLDWQELKSFCCTFALRCFRINNVNIGTTGIMHGRDGASINQRNCLTGVGHRTGAEACGPPPTHCTVASTCVNPAPNIEEFNSSVLFQVWDS